MCLINGQKQKGVMDNSENQITTKKSETINANKSVSKDSVKISDNSNPNDFVIISGSEIEVADENDIKTKNNISGFNAGGPPFGDDMIDAAMEQQENMLEANRSVKVTRDLTKGADVHAEFLDAKASLYAEDSKSDSRRMSKLKSALNELFPATGESLIEKEIPDASRDYQVEMAKIRDKYARAIEKLEEYVQNRQKPRSQYGKVRLQRVERLLDIARKDARFFASGAENSAYIRQFREANENRLPTWGDLLREARSYKVSLSAAEGGASAQAKKFKEGNVTYFFKKDEYVYKDGAVNGILKNKKSDPLAAEFDRQLKQYKSKAFYESVLKDMKKYSTGALEDDYKLFTGNEDVFYDCVEYVLSFDNGHGLYKEAEAKLRFINAHINNPLLENLLNITKTYKENAAGAGDQSDADTLRIQKSITGFKNKYSSAYALSTLAEAHNLKGGRSLDMRNVATSRMADLLGIGDVVMRSRSATITNADGTVETGVLMEDVKGESFKELIKHVERKNIIFTRKAGMDIAKLMLLDILCCQSDRHSGNFHVHYTQKNGITYITKIIGIDNDLSFSEFELDKTEKLKNMKNPTIFNEAHKCIFEFMDKTLYNNLMTLDMQTVKLVLADCQISKKEFNAMEKRLKAMQKELRRKKQEKEKNHHDFLVEDADTFFNKNNSQLADIIPHLVNKKDSQAVDGFAFDIVVGDSSRDPIAQHRLASEAEAG